MAHVLELSVGVDDEGVVNALTDADAGALDCPLGWPEPFVEFLLAHRDGHVRPPVGVPGLAWRRMLSRRLTDLACERAAGVRPLSVAADRIAAVAMRAAGLLAAMSSAGRPVDRAGGGAVVECYPAAALKLWGLSHQAYKKAPGATALSRLVDALSTALPGLRLDDHEQLARSSDDAFDALICALVARAAALGQVTAPPPEQRHIAAREGWIVLPQQPLLALAGHAPKQDEFLCDFRTEAAGSPLPARMLTSEPFRASPKTSVRP